MLILEAFPFLSFFTPDDVAATLTTTSPAAAATTTIICPACPACPNPSGANHPAFAAVMGAVAGALITVAAGRWGGSCLPAWLRRQQQEQEQEQEQQQQQQQLTGPRRSARAAARRQRG